MADLSVIIPAAGSGTRLGGEIPKPFIKIGGKTILEHTIERFDNPNLVSEILVPLAPKWLERVSSMICVNNVRVPVRFVEGGAERMFSINNALKVLHSDSQYVAIHDAVRPFFTDKLLNKLVLGVREFGAIIPGLPVSDTIKIVDDDDIVTQTPLRSRLYAVQTPQCFRTEWIKKAYETAIQGNYFGTDDAALCEISGYPVKIISGERENFKITWPEDLEKAHLLLKNRRIDD